jgi:hypothetical protein
VVLPAVKEVTVLVLVTLRLALQLSGLATELLLLLVLDSV